MTTQHRPVVVDIVTTQHRPVVVDIDRLRDVADSRHLLHQLRQARRHQVVPLRATVPGALLEVPPCPTPIWQRSSPRAGRLLPIAYHRRCHALRALCRWVPLLTPLARWLA